MPENEAVVVTGAGATTPVGGDAAATWAALLAGTSGVRALTQEWAEELPVHVAAPLAHEPTEELSRVEARTLDRVEQIALVAARQAWRDAGAPEADPVRIAVVIGTGTGGVLTTLGQDDVFERSGARKLSPHTVPMLMPNGPAARVSMDLGAKGGARTPVSACASGAEALALGLDLIRAGRADVAVAGGVEACLHPFTLAAFAQMKALSPRADDPESVSRPFDTARSGFVMGEGGCVLVLERAGFARARGARVLGTLAGAAVGSSADHITASDAAGQVAAIELALRDAGLGPRDIGHVHAHATSTPSGDLAEAAAVRQAIGDHAPVSATKSMTGHMLGASGALGALSALLTLRDGVAPAVRNLDDLDPAVDLDVVRGENRTGSWHAALANSFGFGGHNVSLVFTGNR
ncbi:MULTISPECIES: beta-ketoacyl-[acyl-carrier-protein] synthase family protein [unclassified Streptomyces]|uniref:beta-ketoacyl-[acyl-carrier-protein] synthase family protein n=1 Tax=unclassified Streptomyces TaxID=2593676 RepID=UPI000DBA0738|nr:MULTISPECIES: beta-ketoacyl-[acyl-carrier-protein] synthase family protein [unclassified Streptomyces]MYT68714.1 beta-ketoacyl-ACP synthase II [Streptomyces sp. SID8367]RAJ86387.1 3-oxoacyl-[acyl-carrier-protein] synthase II [Streptomyces sp. PsTaAH-137]